MGKKTKVICIHSLPEFKKILGVDRLDIAKGSKDYYGAINGSRVCGVAPDAVPLLNTPDRLGVMEITDGVEVWYFIVPIISNGTVMGL